MFVAGARDHAAQTCRYVDLPAHLLTEKYRSRKGQTPRWQDDGDFRFDGGSPPPPPPKKRVVASPRPAWHIAQSRSMPIPKRNARVELRLCIPVHPAVARTLQKTGRQSRFRSFELDSPPEAVSSPISPRSRWHSWKYMIFHATCRMIIAADARRSLVGVLASRDASSSIDTAVPRGGQAHEDAVRAARAARAAQVLKFRQMWSVRRVHRSTKVNTASPVYPWGSVGSCDVCRGPVHHRPWCSVHLWSETDWEIRDLACSFLRVSSRLLL